MSNRQILYEANLQRTGTSLKLGAFALIIIAAIIFVWCFFAENFSGKLFVLAVLGIFIAGTAWQFGFISKWSKKSGSYQIYLDSIGLHAHSDEPVLGRPFSVAASNLYHLVQKRVGDVEGIEYEYYVEEKSGERHQISPTLVNYNLDAMDMFEKIASEFPSVKIIREGL